MTRSRRQTTEARPGTSSRAVEGHSFAQPDRLPLLSGDMLVTLDLIPEGFDRILEALPEGARPRIKYDRGSLTFVSPSAAHERGGERLDFVVKAICGELRIAFRSTASTLFRRRDLDSGIEADKTYYIANQAALRGLKDEIDLSVTPPPDLVIEVAHSHSPSKSLTICQGLGVPEVWVYWTKKARLDFLHLDGNIGCYTAVPSSRAFPFLTPDDVLLWVESDGDEPDNEWDFRLRNWVRDVLGPRRAGA